MKTTIYTFKTDLKKNSIHFSFLVVSLFLILIGQSSIAQTVHTVDNSPESGAQFTSLQAALDAATAGDIIYIHPSSTSYGNINIYKEIKLVGPGHDPAILDGLRATIGDITLRENSANTEIIGLNIKNVSAYSYGANTGNIRIINNRITNEVQGYHNGSHSEDWIIEGNYLNITSLYYNKAIDGHGSVNWNIRNNFINGVVYGINHTTIITNNLFVHEEPFGEATIFYESNSITSPIVTNNMFIFTDPDVTALTYSGSTAITYTNCLTFQAGGGAALPALPGTGNLDNTDPLFTDVTSGVNNFYNNDYTLEAGSPAINAATDGGDIGIFGRNFPFDIHGRPHSMPYPEVMTILNTVVQPGQDLNVEFQASQKN